MKGFQGLDINGCRLSYFEGTANVHCYTICTLTTLHCSKVLFIQCCHMKRYSKILLQKCEGCTHFCEILYIQWGKKVFSQPPIVQVLPLKKMREACNFHHRYTSTMRDKIRKINPENCIVGFLKNLFANYGGK